MTITIIDAGSVSRTVAAMKVLDGSTLRTIFRAKVMDADGTTLRTVATFSPAMTASTSPSFIDVSAPSSTMTTPPCTVTPVGGTAPYTYSCVVTFFDGFASPVVNSPTSATTTFTQSSVVSGDVAQTTFTWTVTDAFGLTTTATVNANFSNITGGT